MTQPPIAPTAATQAGIDKVLLATDLTDASGPATDEAIRLSKALGATLLAVSVIDPGALRLPGGRFSARVDQVRATREVAAQELVARGRRSGVQVRFMIWHGDPGPAIVDAADAEDADIIVVGSRGRGAVGRLVMGSVSGHVVRHATRPVMVVRQDGRAASTRPGRAGDGHPTIDDARPVA
jgi:nucleotide-binding universal stress UspA family protein